MSENASVDKEIHISPATEDAVRLAVYQQRYRVLVERENWKLKGTDNKALVVKDAYDDYAFILIAKGKNGWIGGSARTVPWRSLPPRLMRDGLPLLLADMRIRISEQISMETCTYSSRLVVARKNDFVHIAPVSSHADNPKRHTVATALCCGLYSFCINSGVQIDFITCLEEHEKFYRKFGYRLFSRGVIDPDLEDDKEHARCNVMYLLIEDIEHLQSVSSPFLSYYRPNSHSPGRHKKLLTMLRNQGIMATD